MDIVIFGYAGRLSAVSHHPLLFRQCLLDLNLGLVVLPIYPNHKVSDFFKDEW